MFGFWCVLAAVPMLAYGQFDLLRPKTVRLYQFKGTCPEHPKAPITLRNVKISQVNRIYYLSMKVVITRNIANGLKLQLSLNRCPSRDSLDACEKYQSVNVNHLCDLLKGTNTPWAQLLEISKPRMECPLKKGTYTVANATFDGSAFQHLPISGWYWKVKAKTFDEVTDDLLMCMMMEGQLAPI